MLNSDEETEIQELKKKIQDLDKQIDQRNAELSINNFNLPSFNTFNTNIIQRMLDGETNINIELRGVNTTSTFGREAIGVNSNTVQDPIRNNLIL
jgi:hypothetical protein